MCNHQYNAEERIATNTMQRMHNLQQNAEGITTNLMQKA